MIIDIHTHSFPEKIAAAALAHLQGNSHTRLFSDGTEAGLSKTAREAGIDISVIVPVATNPRQVSHINDSSARINESTDKTGLLSLGCIHPDLPRPEEELLRIKELGLKGIKIHPVYQGVDLDDERFLHIFRHCAKLGLFVLTHSGIDIGLPGIVHCTPAMARNVLDQVEGLTLILAHMGGWRNWEEVPHYLAGTGAYIDTSFSTGRFYPLPDSPWREEDCRMLSPGETTDIIKALGADRVLFGTDSPWSDQRESLDFIRSLPLPQEEKDQILGENARAILGI